MSSAPHWLWENVVGLVVEDSQLAIGIMVALALVGTASLVSALHPFVGWILLLFLIGLLLFNLALTARRAKRRIA